MQKRKAKKLYRQIKDKYGTLVKAAKAFSVSPSTMQKLTNLGTASQCVIDKVEVAGFDVSEVGIKPRESRKLAPMKMKAGKPFDIDAMVDRIFDNQPNDIAHTVIESKLQTYQDRTFKRSI